MDEACMHSMLTQPCSSLTMNHVCYQHHAVLR
jgi:hypothetical protein